MRDKPPATQGENTQSRGRSARLSVRLDPQVQELLKAVAEAEGVRPSALVREAIEKRIGLARKRVGQKLPPLSRLTQEDRRSIQRFTAEANRVGVNLNQIARQLNSGAQVHQVPELSQSGRRHSPMERLIRDLEGLQRDIQVFTEMLDSKLGGDT